MDWEAVLARGTLVLAALLGGYFIALWAVLVIWTYRDIETRSKNVVTQIAATLLSVLFWIPGVLLYMILRPKETLDSTFQRSLEEEYLIQDLEELPACPSCQKLVQDDFVLCPHCHTRLREPCTNCGRLIERQWTLCPYCAAPHDQHDALPEKITPAASRWSAPQLRTSPTPLRSPLMLGVERRVQGQFDEIDEEHTEQVSLSVFTGARSVVRQLERIKTRSETGQQSLPPGVEPEGVIAETPAQPVANGHHPPPIAIVPRGRFKPRKNVQSPDQATNGASGSETSEQTATSKSTTDS